MRRVVRDRVAASLEMAKSHLEEWIAERLEYPAGFPYLFTESVISIREMRRLRIRPAIEADYPPVEIVATMRGSLAAHVGNLPSDAGPRRLDVDLRLLAKGTVRGDGRYDIAPQSAAVTAWWRGTEPLPWREAQPWQSGLVGGEFRKQ
jgi:hypothetical protein